MNSTRTNQRKRLAGLFLALALVAAAAPAGATAGKLHPLCQGVPVCGV
jgi:hypothetical protein